MLKDKTKFAYAIGRIRSLEKYLMPQETLKRMVEASSFEAAFAILNETARGTALGRQKTHFEVDQLLQTEIENTVTMLTRLVPKNQTLNAIFLKYLVHNLKVFYRSKKTGTKPNEKALYNIFPEKTKKLENSILNTEETLYNELDKLIELLDKTPNDTDIDKIADLWYLNQLLKHAQQNQITMLVNLASIRLAWAHKKINQEIDPATESALENKMMQIIKKAKYIAFGIEPLIAFYFAKEQEIKNIRIILKGKKHQLPQSLIINNLRETYV